MTFSFLGMDKWKLKIGGNMNIKIGDIVEGEVIDFTHEGNGVLRIDDFIYFVQGGLIGDKVRAKVEKVKKNFAIGTVTEIVEPSKDRIDLDHNIDESLGGIPLINYKYEKQLEWKREKVRKDLEKFAEIEDIEVNEVIAMEDPYRYRNHVQIAVGNRQGKTILGFYQAGSNHIVPMRETILQSEIGNKVLALVKQWIDRYDIKAYDRKKKKGTLRHIGIRTNHEDEVMLILVTGEEIIPKKDELIELIKNNTDQVKSIYQNINKMNSPIVYGEKYKHLFGEEKLTDKIGEYKFSISPNSFFQINRIQAEKLYDKTVEYLDLNEKDLVYDLYSGTGTIAIYMADKVERVYGIEVVKAAIKDAKENAVINNMDNTEFIHGRAEDILPKLAEIKNPNKIVLDPPSKGCEKELLETIIKISPERIVYVSCNSSTMSRDIKELKQAGYKLVEVQPVDMFPHAMDIEVVSLLTK